MLHNLLMNIENTPENCDAVRALARITSTYVDFHMQKNADFTEEKLDLLRKLCVCPRNMIERKRLNEVLDIIRLYFPDAWKSIGGSFSVEGINRYFRTERTHNLERHLNCQIRGFIIIDHIAPHGKLAWGNPIDVQGEIAEDRIQLLNPYELYHFLKTYSSKKIPGILKPTR